MSEKEKWDYKKKFGYKGFYEVKNDIYQKIPESWRQKAEIIIKKGTIINVIQHKYLDMPDEQFHTGIYWFKKNEITPIL